DPGYAIVGWGGVDYVGNRFAPVDFGAVTTGAGLPFEQRLSEVYDGVCEVIHRTRPEVLAIAKLCYQHNQTTVIGEAEARGVILLAPAQAGLPVYEYTPMQVKQAVTGYGKAVKKQVQEKIGRASWREGGKRRGGACAEEAGMAAGDAADVRRAGASGNWT